MPGLALAADGERLEPESMLAEGADVLEAGKRVNFEFIEVDGPTILPPVCKVLL